MIWFSAIVLYYLIGFFFYRGVISATGRSPQAKRQRGAFILATAIFLTIWIGPGIKEFVRFAKKKLMQL